MDATVAGLLTSQGPQAGGEVVTHAEAQEKLNDANTRLRRLQDTIAAGVDPAALVEPLNQAQAARKAAEARLKNVDARDVITEAEIYAMIDSLGDVSKALSGAKPQRLADLYNALGLQVRYEPGADEAEITIHPESGGLLCVSGGGFEP